MPLWGVRTHAIWLGSSVFDGARAFEGTTPDLDLHCARVNDSAKTMFLKPMVPRSMDRPGAGGHEEVSMPDTPLYIRPMYWAERGRTCRPAGRSGIDALVPLALRHADAQARRLLDHAVAVQAADHRNRAGRRQGRLPLSEQRPRHAGGESRGFDNCLVCDMLGNVAELANSNVFIAKDGVVITPMPNGTFLNGITRQRVIKLLRGAGVTVIETVMRYRDFENADEIFATGNASKVLPVTRIGERSLQPGPFYRKARELYWAFAHSG